MTYDKDSHFSYDANILKGLIDKLKKYEGSVNEIITIMFIEQGLPLAKHVGLLTFCRTMYCLGNVTTSNGYQSNNLNVQEVS